jgi:hypothetical protein
MNMEPMIGRSTVEDGNRLWLWPESVVAVGVGVCVWCVWWFVCLGRLRSEAGRRETGDGLLQVTAGTLLQKKLLENLMFTLR